MTTRERWTIYPLLCLAIGLAMRACVVPPERVGELEAVRLTCRELVVVDPRGTAVVRAGRIQGEGGGRIEVHDAGGQTAVAINGGASADDATIEFYDPRGRQVDRIVPTGSMLPPPNASRPAREPVEGR